MVSENIAYFVCDECGFERRSDTIQYDDLGYPVCPTCGAESRSAVTI